ncbi:MAG: cytochrome c3 family protein [Deltaproteobacteria bacterium]|jgi:hypothetical protein|nr:cytochrome c3 family protein [Deltaproteobacteria bacterium]
MKYLITLLIVLTFLLTGITQAKLTQAAEETAQAGSAKATEKYGPQHPITIEGGTSRLATVIFNHSSHSGTGIACITCHHNSSSDKAVSSCREVCHAAPGARARNAMSMFMAFHAKNTDRSCYGCHSMRAEAVPAAYPKFKSCQPCHTAPASAAK